VGYGEGSDETGYCCQKHQKLVGGTSFKTHFRMFNVKWKLIGDIGTMCSGEGGIRLENAETYARWRGISGEKAGGGLREQVERVSGEYSTASYTCDFTSSYATVAEGRTRAERRLYITCVCSDITHPHTDNFRYICDFVRFVPVRIGRSRYCCRVDNRLVCRDCLRLIRKL
jgi:hypothetical protein